MASEIKTPARKPDSQGLENSGRPVHNSIDAAATAIHDIFNRPSDAPAPPPRREVPEPPPRREQAEPPLRNRREAPKEPEETPDVEPDALKASEDEGETPDTPETEPKAKPPEAAESEDADEIELEPGLLAQALGVDEDDLLIDDEGAIQLRAKIDGKTDQVSLRDLRDSYQQTKTAQQRLQKLSEERKEFEAHRDSTNASLKEKAEYMQQAMAAIEQGYLTDFQSVNWDNLRESDPEQYTARRQDFTERQQRVQQFRQWFAQQQEQITANAKQAKEQAQDKGRKVLDEIFSGPDYKHAPWDEQAKNELGQYMVDQGFTSEEIGDVTNPMVFKWARDAMLYAQSRREAQKTMKKVIKLPKVKSSKPGPRQAPDVGKKTKIDDARKRQIAEGGSMRASADLISAIFQRGN